METLFQLRDYGYDHLTELTLDGLLIRLTETTWVRKGAVLSPADRIAALKSLIPPGLAVSHDSAWWVHRGLGRAPSPLSFITLPRRRWVSHDGFEVHEVALTADEWQLIGRLPITTEERTLYDLFLPHLRTPSAQSAQALRGIVDEVPDALCHRFRLYLDAVSRRPFVAQMRALVDGRQR
ncbi:MULTISPECIES: hypothetical protein [unclassified Brevibacterium]|jgi:hypothetical protein|uniref:hypothetical protein n=1 Tax=unclassified Brevibacterium TaxID=2614124 RepID=UPI001BABE2DF|nr:MULTISPECIES: hypothetical protein [unclassified Brevibacterium]QUL80338.1 hypothetical protein IG171_05980 [Brevibacterium sp. SMBL_HHYL_HB1]HJA59818.1 hypothetical protein [Candidatus Brevibacterium intestinavium]